MDEHTKWQSACPTPSRSPYLSDCLSVARFWRSRQTGLRSARLRRSPEDLAVPSVVPYVPFSAYRLDSGSGTSLFPFGRAQLQGEEDRGAELADEGESSLCRAYP